MIRAFSAEETLARAGQLAEVLLDCIAGRASGSFMEDFSRDEATEYWRAIAADEICPGGGRRRSDSC